MKKILYTILAIVAINACKNENETKLVGDAKFFIKKNGPKPVLGDKVKMTYTMYYDMPDGTVKEGFKLTDSADLAVEMEKDFVGGPTDCVLQMGAGDSAEFKISADSIFNKMYSSQLPQYMKKGDKLRIVIKLKEVFPLGGGDVKIHLDPTIKAN